MKNKMNPVSAHAVANAFLDLAWSEDKQLTNMQLQKLVYIAHGYTLGLLDQPLCDDNVHAWKHGPVFPSLYEDLSQYGSRPVTEALQTYDTLQDLEQRNIIEVVYANYKGLHAFTLSDFTHKPNTPWDQTWKITPYGVIETGSVQKYYKKGLKPILKETENIYQQAMNEYHEMTPEELEALDRELGLV